MALVRWIMVTLLWICLHSVGSGAGKFMDVKKHLPLDGLPNLQLKTAQNSHYLPDKIIIRLQTGQRGLGKQVALLSSSLSTFLAKYSAWSVKPLFPEMNSNGKRIDVSMFWVLTYTSPLEPFQVAKEIGQHPDVLYAEPWFIYPVDDVTTCTPNDSLRNLQWALTKIKTDSAFCIAGGDTSISIGIIDTGVQWDHPDLKDNIYINPGETGLDAQGHDKRFNKIDDDGDGYIDDWHGWDFGGADYNKPVGDNDPTPTNAGAGHGTHVAGIAGARTNNISGVSGVSNNCRIIPIKAGSDNDGRGPGGTPYIVFGFEGILYASLKGAAVINCSWGGSGASQFEQEIIDSVTAWGSLVVAAAGNGAREPAPATPEDPNYPASYRNVLSVAATLTNDYRTSYTQYGEHIDLCAPGGDGLVASGLILNTWYPNTYAYLSGTSMASPHVSGIAALVKSKFPSYSPVQVGEQVRVTCDNIYGVNTGSTINYKLGKGRINALRAVTETWPSLRMISFRGVDSIIGNNNGALEPGEKFALKMVFKNYLKPTSPAASIQLATYDGNVSIPQGIFTIGSVPTMGTVSNDANPFVVLISSGIPAGRIVQFVLKITDGTYTDIQLFSILMYPTFATHNVNNIQMTITNNGHLGFNDFSKNIQGVGFVYKGANELYEAGLMIGYDTSKFVDVVRNELSSQNADFTSSQIYQLVNPGPIATQEGFAQFTDAGALATNLIGLKVDTRSYAFHDSPDTNYIIVRYDITNNSGAPITNVYAGMFFDWDMVPIDGSDPNGYKKNKTSFDQSRNLAYAWDDAEETPIYCGTRALDSAISYQALINDDTIDLTKGGKWRWLTGGIVPMKDTTADIHYSLSEGPFTIPNGSMQRVGFAIIAGDNLSDLQRNADFAKVKWREIVKLTAVSQEKNILPISYALFQNYPNPFNPSTVISYEIPSAGRVTLNVFNVLGQVVTSLVNQIQQRGRYDVTFNATSLPSGVYFCRLSAVNDATGFVYNNVKKLLLLR